MASAQRLLRRRFFIIFILFHWNKFGIDVSNILVIDILYDIIQDCMHLRENYEENHEILVRYFNCCPAMFALAVYVLSVETVVFARSVIFSVVIIAFCVLAGAYFKRLRASIIFGVLGLLIGILESSGFWSSYERHLPRRNCHSMIRCHALERSISMKQGNKCLAAVDFVATFSPEAPNEPEWHKCCGRIIAICGSETQVDYGDNMELEGAFVTFDGDRREQYYRSQRINRKFYVNNVRSISKARGIAHLLQRFLSLRYLLAERLVEGIENVECAEMYKAMIFGMRDGMSYSLRESFVKSATVHLFSISGLHVSIFTGCILFFAKMLMIPVRYRAIAITPILLCYVFLSGGAPSALRAFNMAVAVSFADIGFRIRSSENALALSALFLLICNPLFVINYGFLFSFTLVFILLKCARCTNSINGIFFERQKWIAGQSHVQRRFWAAAKYIASSLLTSIAAWFGSAGLMMRTNYIVSFSSIILNVLISPLAFVLVGCVIPKILFSFICQTLSLAMGKLLNLCLLFLLNASSICAMDCFFVTTSQISVVMLLLYYAAVFVGTSGIRPPSIRFVAYVLAICIIVLQADLPDGRELVIATANAGEPSIAIIGRENRLLQCGDKSATISMVDELNRRGIHDISINVNESREIQHLYQFLQNLDIDSASLYKPYSTQKMHSLAYRLKKKGVHIEELSPAEGISIDNSHEGITTIEYWGGKVELMPSMKSKVFTMQ